jgi:hypothetical protein
MSRQADAYYRARIVALIKERRETLGLSWKQVARKLEEIGYPVNEDQVSIRINRGNFSFIFAMALGHVLGFKHFDVIPPMPRKATPPKRT